MADIDQIEEIDCFDNVSDDDLWNLLDGFVQNKSNGETDNEFHTLTDNSQTKDKISCELCNSDALVFDSDKAVYTCTECGVESGKIFDQRPEWTNFEDGPQDNARCGVATNPFLPKSSMGTVIGGTGFSRLRIIQSWNQMPYKERSLSEVLQHIDSKLKTYRITKAVIDNAKILYKNISEIKHGSGINKGKTIIIRGLNRRGLIAACAYYGAKLQGTPRSTKEIADVFNLKITQVTKGCRKFLELINYQSMTYNLHSSHAYDFIERFGYKLKLKKTDIDIAIRIAENINKLDIASDHQPTSVAAGSILLMSNIYELNIPKKNISEIFGISEVTITKTFKKIYPYKKILVNDDMTNLLLKKINSKMANALNNPSEKLNEPLPSMSTNDSDEIKNNLSKIFMMPDDYDSEGLINGNTTLSSILNSESKTRTDNDSYDGSINQTLNVSSININLNNIKKSINDSSNLSKPKRGRGRPRKVINTVTII